MDNNREALTAFYRKALTVNTETSATEVLNKVLAEDFISSSSVESKGKSALIGQVEHFWKLIPDLKWEPQEMIQEGNKLVVRSKVSGTPNGDFMGLPTNGTKSFEIMSIDFHAMENGQMKSVHHLEDWGTALKQLKS
ncbi:hypothetical protein BH11BAC2_BH11BAC2_21490 [soil metagenome]